MEIQYGTNWHPDTDAEDPKAKREVSWMVDRNESSVYVYFPYREQLWLYSDGGPAKGGLAVIAEQISDPAKILAIQVLILKRMGVENDG